ncbi:MAG: phosphopantetheine-binding protein [Thermomicrobiales bacterium]
MHAAQKPHRDGITLLDLVREVWREVLGLDAVGPEDDFFEIGGHSLVVPAAIARLAARLGLDVPLHALFDAPTPAEMAELIAELRHERERDAAHGVTPFFPSWVVPLQREGAGRPVFVFPAGADEALALSKDAQIATLVGRQHPFWGLRRDDPLLDGAREAGVPVLAATYAKQMRRIQGPGPFLLFGNCVGGYLAWETARHLLAAGETVAGILFYEVPLRADFATLMPGFTPAHVSRPWRLSLYYRPQALPIDLTHLMTAAWQARGWWGPWHGVVRGTHETVVISDAAPDGQDALRWRDAALAQQVRAWIEKAEARGRDA